MLMKIIGILAALVILVVLTWSVMMEVACIAINSRVDEKDKRHGD